MIFFVNPSSPEVRDVISAGVLACMAQPSQGNVIEEGWTWAVDNGCFTGGLNAGRWITFLEKYQDRLDGCVFAVVPDRLADPAETQRLWRIWRPVVVELGYPPAFVAQDGQTPATVPWDELAVLFIGGSTEFKRGPEAMNLAAEAQARNKWVHWGRVNSRRRFAMAALDGDSCDGTHITFGPKRRLPELLGWLNTMEFPQT